MKASRFVEITFQGYLQNIYYSNDAMDEKMLAGLFFQYEKLGAAICPSVPLLYLIDYTKGEYLVMTEAIKYIISYDARAFLEGGIPQLVDVFHQDDFKIYNEKIFPANIWFLQSRPQELHDKFIFSYNFRVRHKNSGEYISILQRGSYITSKETGLPLYSLGVVVDVSSFKRDTLIYHTIEFAGEREGFREKQLMEENFFFPNEKDSLLSKREKCILGYMTEGLSSKQIADKLYISENTVANHRKNMLMKTNTKNVAQLVAFAYKSRII